MPIIKPEVQKVLAKAGLIEDVSNQASKSVDQNLDHHGLDNSSIAEELSSIALHSQSDHLRLRAIETALKVKGALREVSAQIPSFTIVIQNSNKTLAETEGINPIIFPRQSLNGTRQPD